MSCGCGGSAAPVAAPTAAMIRRVNQTVVNCDYTPELLQSWLISLKCVKSSNTFDLYNSNHTKFNSYLGIVQSALNYISFPCYFVKQLDTIAPVIEAIKNNGQC